MLSLEARILKTIKDLKSNKDIGVPDVIDSGLEGKFQLFGDDSSWAQYAILLE